MRKAGTRFRSGGIVVFAAPGVSGLARVAFVAGRSVGNAVRRNRAKRRLREALRRVGAAPGRDYVVVATAAVANTPFEAVVEWLRQGLRDEE